MVIVRLLFSIDGEDGIDEALSVVQQLMSEDIRFKEIDIKRV